MLEFNLAFGTHMIKSMFAGPLLIFFPSSTSCCAQVGLGVALKPFFGERDSVTWGFLFMNVVLRLEHTKCVGALSPTALTFTISIVSPIHTPLVLYTRKPIKHTAENTIWGKTKEYNMVKRRKYKMGSKQKIQAVANAENTSRPHDE